MKTKIIGIIEIAFIVGLIIFGFTTKEGTCNYSSADLIKSEVSTHYHGSDDALNKLYQILDEE
jgi:hypothetical protein